METELTGTSEAGKPEHRGGIASKHGKAKNPDRLGWRLWLVIWLMGLAGQLVWNIENQWFNTFVYAKIAPDPNIITSMVVVSATVSTFATFFLGTLSDRVGKRMKFILIGYILWGITTIGFGCAQFIQADSFNYIVPAVCVVLFDAVMSFCGSIGNDVGFNSWMTDISNPRNRGSIGTVIAVQPIIATIVGSVLFGAVIDAFGWLKIGMQTLDYFMMFTIAGVAIMIIGIISYLLAKDAPDLIPHREMSFGKQFVQPFNFKLLRNNKLLIAVLFIDMVFFISFNLYFVHVLNFFIYGTTAVPWLNDITGGGLGVNTIAGGILALGLLFGVPLIIISGHYLNKQKFIPIINLSVIFNLLGLAILYVGELLGATNGAEFAVLLLGIFFVGTSYMGILQALTAWLKNLFPDNMRSQFEGVRMIFFVFVPMFLGTLVGDAVITKMGKPIVMFYPTGIVEGFVPNYWLFLVAFILSALTFIPIGFAAHLVKKEKKAKEVEALAKETT